MKINGLLAIVIALVFFLRSCFEWTKISKISNDNHDILPQPESFIQTFQNEIYNDLPPAPLDTRIQPLHIKESSLLNAKELDYYHNHTWDPSKTLEENRKTLTNAFLKTCIDRVDDIISIDNGVVLKLASRHECVVLRPAEVEFIRDYELRRIIYLLTDSPYFCRLVRNLLAKYKCMSYTPQKAVFLITKGEASHVTYNVLHHVLNLRIVDYTFLSALDCRRYKMQFGAIIFHEMLHWYHRLSDPTECDRRGRSTSCIRRRFYDHKIIDAYGWSEDAAAGNFSNDEEFYTMYGLRENEFGEIVLDILCEAAYTSEQYGYVRGSHVTFRRSTRERSWITGARDTALLKFFQNTPPPKFGLGDFKVKD
ncbi:MAG: hypothetical protein LBJ16_03165 [Holosporaceae bacterium]|nr:hypothetical protein [Holosporaceae bacterium]